MVKRVYVSIRNALLFYFMVAAVFVGVQIKGGNLVANIAASLIFGILMAFVPFMLGFFRITVNTWSRLFISIAITFVLLFLIYTGIWNVGTVGGSVIDLGLWSGSIVRMDPLGTLIGGSIVIGALSVFLHIMAGEGEKW